VTHIAAGPQYSLAVKDDGTGNGTGTVWAWGRNDSGQLGNGTFVSSPTPVQVQGLTGVLVVAAAGGYSLALKDDGSGRGTGTVWAWGENNNGQLGDGTTVDRNTPAEVQGVAGVRAIAAGGSHVLVLLSDGTVWAWGSNASGERGDGTTVAASAPNQVLGLSGVTAIAAGGQHSLALLADTTVRAWGSNSSGQLGDNTEVNTLSAVPVVFPVHAGVRPEGLMPPLASLAEWPAASSPLLPDRPFELGETLPFRLQLLCLSGGSRLTDATVAPPRIVGQFRNGDAIGLDALNISAREANDGFDFRYSADDSVWVYNLRTASPAGPGSYVVVIRMPDGREFAAAFEVR
jgi:hypothetical protein